MTDVAEAPAPAGADAAPTAALPEGVTVTTLAEGTRVITERVPGVRSVAVGFWIGTGSRHERAPVAGASHFLEHLLFKGTRRRSARDIAEVIDAVGGELNAFTAKEHTCAYVRCLDRDLPLAIDVLADMVTGSRIRSADVEAEREVVVEEIHSHLDTPDDLVHSVFSEAVFGAHPLGREVLGDEATIRGLSRDQLNRWYRRQYAPSNVVVAVAGDVVHDDVVAEVAAALEGWQADAPRPVARRRPGRIGQALAVRSRPTEQTHVVLGGLGIARDDPRRHAAHVLNEALGGGMSSRLFQEVRERRGLAYTVFSYLSLHAEGGTFGVYAGTAPERADAVLDVVVAELERAAVDGLGAEELARAKGALSGALVLGMEDTGSRMSRLGKSLVTGTPLISLDELVEAIDAVSGEDVRAVAGALLSGPRSLAVVGPVSDERAAELAGRADVAA